MRDTQQPSFRKIVTIVLIMGFLFRFAYGLYLFVIFEVDRRLYMYFESWRAMHTCRRYFSSEMYDRVHVCLVINEYESWESIDITCPCICVLRWLGYFAMVFVSAPLFCFTAINGEQIESNSAYSNTSRISSTIDLILVNVRLVVYVYSTVNGGGPVEKYGNNPERLLHLLGYSVTPPTWPALLRILYQLHPPFWHCI